MCCVVAVSTAGVGECDELWVEEMSKDAGMVIRKSMAV